MTTIYGINNCDTVKKALKWLDANNVSYQFYNFKKEALTPELLKQFSTLASWDELINKRSTTFRNLPAEVKENFTADVAFEQAIAQPTLLKRPLLIKDNALTLGFKAPVYEGIFN